MTNSPAWPSTSVDPRGELPIAPRSYLFHLIATVMRHRQLRVEALLAPMGLNMSRYRAIVVIAILRSCAMSELADFSAVDRTTMTRTVDQLVAAGLVERATPAHDRRQVILTLTGDGNDLCERATDVVDAFNETLVRDIEDGLMRKATSALETLLGATVHDEALLTRLLLRPDQPRD
jgi:DNA-binding MarR family transcriptional regulator